MSILYLCLSAAAAVAAALCTGLVMHWRSSRAVAGLSERLAKSELGRQAAHERSTQARAQIGQLSKALAEARALLASHGDAAAPAEPVASAEPIAIGDAQRLERERLVRAHAPTLVMPRRGAPAAVMTPRQAPSGFVDTQVM